MPTLTINIETNLLHQAKIYAALQGISISQIIKGDLVKMTKAIRLGKAVRGSRYDRPK